MAKDDDHTGDLFGSPPEPPKKPPRKPPTGRELAADGIKRAEQHADAVVLSWSDRAYGYVLEFAGKGVDFMAEDVRAVALRDGLPAPPDGRAWGGALLRAAREGKIRRVGYAPMKSPNCHANPKSVWRGL